MECFHLGLELFILYKQQVFDESQRKVKMDIMKSIVFV